MTFALDLPREALALEGEVPISSVYSFKQLKLK